MNNAHSGIKLKISLIFCYFKQKTVQIGHNKNEIPNLSVQNMDGPTS